MANPDSTCCMPGPRSVTCREKRQRGGSAGARWPLPASPLLSCRNDHSPCPPASVLRNADRCSIKGHGTGGQQWLPWSQLCAPGPLFPPPGHPVPVGGGRRCWEHSTVGSGGPHLPLAHLSQVMGSSAQPPGAAAACPGPGPSLANSCMLVSLSPAALWAWTLPCSSCCPVPTCLVPTYPVLLNACNGSLPGRLLNSQPHHRLPSWCFLKLGLHQQTAKGPGHENCRAGAAPGGQGRGTSRCLFEEGVSWAAGTAAPQWHRNPQQPPLPPFLPGGVQRVVGNPGSETGHSGLKSLLCQILTLTLGKSRNPALELSLLSCKMDLLINHYGD